MFQRVVFIFVVFFSNNFFWAIATGSDSSHSSVCDLFSSKPLPYDTSSPINVNTHEAIRANISKPLFIQNGLFGPLLVKNTGYALEVFGNPEVLSGGATYGGVLCGKYFIFHKARFYFTQNVKGRSYTAINGKGGPLTLSIIYYNKEYGSFNNSLYKRDGVVIENFQSTYTPLPNPLFTPVGILINLLLREPGTQLYVNEALVYAWFYRVPFVHQYFAYPGSYIDLESGKQYPCAIEILLAKTFHFLGESQFRHSFLQMKGADKKKIDNSQPLYPVGQRPITLAEGFKGVFTVF